MAWKPQSLIWYDQRERRCNRSEIAVGKLERRTRRGEVAHEAWVFVAAVLSEGWFVYPVTRSDPGVDHAGGSEFGIIPFMSYRSDTRGYLAARPAIQAATPTATKNTAAIQACGSSGSLFATIATVIVSAAIPHINAMAIQHR